MCSNTWRRLCHNCLLTATPDNCNSAWSTDPLELSSDYCIRKTTRDYNKSIMPMRVIVGVCDIDICHMVGHLNCYLRKGGKGEYNCYGWAAFQEQICRSTANTRAAPNTARQYPTGQQYQAKMQPLDDYPSAIL